ncbi:MAG: FkbM family methyltransferase [Terriglobales bacterium]
MSQQTLHQREIAQATLQGPRGPLPFNLFKTDVSFQVANSIFAGVTYPTISFVSDVKTVVDIGANVGAASVYFAIAYPNAKVYAFEPGSAPCSLLRQNVEPLRNVTVFPFGLHSREQRVSLFQGKNDSVESSLCSSSRTDSESEEIRLVCASDFFAGRGVNRIDVLKIDTEGCEVPILQSLHRYLPDVKVLYVEYHSERDRRMIDEILAGTHVLWRGNVAFAYRGEFCYLKRELVPDESETHTCEILMGWE